MNPTIKIGITDCGKFDNYRRWIETTGVEVIKLGFQSQNAGDVEKCDGVVFSGGEDLDPEQYGRPEFVAEYGLKEIIPERDRFEYQVLEKALTTGKPVLGICRGLQLINVYLGGTLVPDIPTLFHSAKHGKINGIDQTHIIDVEEDSLLKSICGTNTGTVNSAHHQSADQPAPLLKVSAYGEPDIVEAMEWKDPADKSWLLMVQWHPERMKDPESPFSAAVKNAFLEVARRD
jgi:putative glutamine amidotransferase